MKYNKAILLLFFAITLNGCASHPPLTPVKISQPDDIKLNCQQLSNQINELEKKIVLAIETHQKKENYRFTYTAVLDTALTILSKGRAGAASHSERSPLATMSSHEQQVIFNLQERHAHLMNIAQEKKCAFAHLNKY